MPHIHPPTPCSFQRLGTRLRLCLFGLALSGWLFPLGVHAQITSGTRLPSNDEQHTLQLINQARSSADGLSILRRLVSNNLDAIAPSTTRDKGDGTPWSANFWSSPISGVAGNMNYFRVHPGDLKRQFMDLAVPNYPLAWHPNLGKVSSGYNSIVIASRGSSAGFPHELAPYAASATFADFAKRYTDGGYGPLADIAGLAENIAANHPSNALARFAAFMIDWGATANGIQDQNPAVGSHRLTIMDDSFSEIGISSQPGWTAGNVTEVQEFGRRFSRHIFLTGAVHQDSDNNGLFTPGEGVAAATITATPVGGGAARQTTSYSSGGYALELNTPGMYRVAVTGAFGAMDVGNVTVGSQNVRRDVVVPATHSGLLQVTLGPVGAVIAGAQWQVDNGAFQSSGMTITGLSPGSHTVAFKAVSGWTAPSALTVTVGANQTTAVSSAYVAASTTSSKAEMASPAGGSALSSGSVPLTWRAGSGATAYWLYVGSSLGANTYHDSGSLAASALTRTVSGLPANGSAVYVRLYSLVGGVWLYNDYTYAASTL